MLPVGALPEGFLPVLPPGGEVGGLPDGMAGREALVVFLADDLRLCALASATPGATPASVIAPAVTAALASTLILLLMTSLLMVGGTWSKGRFGVTKCCKNGIRAA
jgi:hypothetical protein